jgi:tRNA U34 5-methylaminomethyl-2-thiouridine-forming methyltransferase MnmC
MKREIQLTADGSHTILIPELHTSYHSHHGAIQESMHVFIDAGLRPFLTAINIAPIRILEIGLGTGLNALLSLREATVHKTNISYLAIEKYPLTELEFREINHGGQLSMQNDFMQIHLAEWNNPVHINNYFLLEKRNCSIHDELLIDPVHCIFFDAFSPTVQPEIWTQPVFEKMYAHLLSGGSLMTYCSKSVVRKAMAAAGFHVHKIPGPWGKREMVRAVRSSF